MSSRRSSRGSGDGAIMGLEIVVGLVVIGTAVALALSIWGVSLATSDYDTLCSGACCKTTQVHERFDFREEALCMDSSLNDDDDDCPFKFFPITYGSLDASDGWFGVEDGVLEIDSTPFTFSWPVGSSGPVPDGGLDHVKFLVYISDENGGFQAYPTHIDGKCGDATELVYEGNVTCTVDLEFENMPYDEYHIMYPAEDYRPAACGFNTIAFQQFNDGVGKGAWQVADFFLTNHSIFIVNERLPFGKPSFGGNLNDYASFTQFTKVARRNPSDYHKLAIAYNAHKGVIRYLIDDVEVYRVNRPGYTPERCETAILHGGEDEPSFPEYVSMGFGTFSILDAFHWNNGFCEGSGPEPLARLYSDPNAYLTPHVFGMLEFPALDSDDFDKPFPDESDRIWGQGADMKIDYLRVYNRKCGCLQ